MLARVARMGTAGGAVGEEALGASWMHAPHGGMPVGQARRCE